MFTFGSNPGGETCIVVLPALTGSIALRERVTVV